MQIYYRIKCQGLGLREVAFGFWVLGFGLWLISLGFRVIRSRIQGLGYKIRVWSLSLGFMVKDLGFRVWGLKI